MKSQSAAGATALDGRKWVVGACERPPKRAKMTRQFEDSSTTASKAAILALLAKQADWKNRCEAVALENQCIFMLAAEAIKLGENLAGSGKADIAASTIFKVPKKKALLLPINGLSLLSRSSLKQRLRPRDWSEALHGLKRTPTRHENALNVRT